MRQLLMITVLAIAVIVGGARLLADGEVVTITTLSADGTLRETPLWIVEVGRQTYLRAGDPEASWMDRLRRRPVLQLERGGRTETFRASLTTDSRVVSAVNEAMARKYGLADRLVGVVFDPSRSVALRLTPADPGDFF